ncbi:MAG: type II secretion system F family protein [Enterobacterales bacterium endosymbiont of Blomia tropicalis]|uniref:type II secretion system F family protein n=1 Tax=Mixta mediterraneensis TaxID=2758443 RepID=UPI0018749D33|nr:type II secretion system F family protein [Mixta mediterraneensis]MBE5254501.1 type II secretion system F family protein [Mixta mediterraneensis]MDL4915784.1 type II secretion system F family protein [Mixta mediterraneensis]
MKEYTVTTLSHGKRVHHTVMADSVNAARRHYTTTDSVVLSVAERKVRQVKHFPLNLFLQELISLLEAGLVVVEAIEALRQSSREGESTLVVDTLIKKLYEGAQLSQAMAILPAVFPPLLINTVASSEQTGHLPLALKRFQHYEQRIAVLRKRIKATLLYPTIVMSAGGVILVFLLGFIIPRFAVVFEGMKSPNGSARFILWWGKLVQSQGPLLLLGCALVICGLFMAIRSVRLRQAALRFLLTVPQLRLQHQLSIMVRFYRTLGLLLQGGITATDALSLSRDVLPITHRPLIERVIAGVQAGQPLSHMLEEQQLTTPVASRLLQVGERIGDLPSMCERIAAFYDDSLERAIEKFSKVFEPVLMMIVGGIVGLVVFLLYMPIFELAGGLQ